MRSDTHLRKVILPLCQLVQPLGLWSQALPNLIQLSLGLPSIYNPVICLLLRFGVLRLLLHPVLVLRLLMRISHGLPIRHGLLERLVHALVSLSWLLHLWRRLHRRLLDSWELRVHRGKAGLVRHHGLVTAVCLIGILARDMVLFRTGLHGLESSPFALSTLERLCPARLRGMLLWWSGRKLGSETWSRARTSRVVGLGLVQRRTRGGPRLLEMLRGVMGWRSDHGPRDRWVGERSR
jgi:hypothetical protein